VDFADESDHTRNGYLCEEIDRALKLIMPEKRNEFLEKLKTRFPVGSLDNQVIQNEPVGSPSPVAQVDVLKDPELLVKSLLEIAPRLSVKSKKIIVKSLGAEPVRRKAGVNYSEQTLQKLQTVLQSGAGQSVDSDRLMELSIILAEFVFRLEPLVWNVWRKLSPRSKIRQSADIKDIMGKFVFNDPDVSCDQIDTELKELQRLIAAIITAISQVGSQFARVHLAKFSPSEISALVKVEGGSIMVSNEVKCWRKYLKLASNLNEDSIETEIRNSIVGYVNSLRKGMG
jgi:hypothetical protein